MLGLSLKRMDDRALRYARVPCEVWACAKVSLAPVQSMARSRCILTHTTGMPSNCQPLLPL
jgi:hypothetical protein